MNNANIIGILLCLLLVKVESFSISLNAAKALILSALIDSSSTALGPPFVVVPDHALAMHPTFIPKRNEVSRIKDRDASLFSDFDNFFDRDLPHLLDESNSDIMKSFRNFNSLSNRVPIDIRDTGKTYQIIADIPGVAKQDAKVDIDDDRMLTITAERRSFKKSNEKEDDSFIRIERTQGVLKRTIKLPDDADNEKISASFENGVLTIEVHKKLSYESKKTKSIPVK
jgi:HSP20 family protein